MKLTKEQGQYLKDRYQTPLFLYDVRELKSRMDSLKKTFCFQTVRYGDFVCF